MDLTSIQVLNQIPPGPNPESNTIGESTTPNIPSPVKEKGSAFGFPFDSETTPKASPSSLPNSPNPFTSKGNIPQIPNAFNPRVLFSSRYKDGFMSAISKNSP